MLVELVKRLLEALAKCFGATPVPRKPFRLGNDLASRIVHAMLRKGYSIDAAPGHVTIVYIEGLDPDGSPNDNAPNRFNDLRICIGFEDKAPRILGVWEATTEPSRFWTQHPMNARGAARIKFGQYTAWRAGDYHGEPSLLQVRPLTVCRDLNKDFKRDGDREDTGLFGIEQHAGYDLPHDDLGRSSAGCLVGRSVRGHRAFMAIVESDHRYQRDRNFIFTAAIMPAKDIT